MPYTPAPFNNQNVIRVTFNMELDLQKLMMVLHCRPVTILVTDYFDAMEDLVSSLQLNLTTGGFWNAVRAKQSNELIYKEIAAQRIWNTRDVAVEIAADTTGDDGDPAAPPNVALSVTKGTVLATRRGVGRVQIPGFPANEMDEGRWNATLVEDIDDTLNVDLVQEYTTALGNQYQWVLPQIGQVNGPFQPITNVFAHDTIRTMHRRTVGLGE